MVFMVGKILQIYAFFSSWENEKKLLIVRRFGTMSPYLCSWKPKQRSAMFEIIVTLGLAAFAIWLLLDSAVEYIRDGQEDTLATEP
jgi:hypothetical protein